MGTTALGSSGQERQPLNRTQIWLAYGREKGVRVKLTFGPKT